MEPHPTCIPHTDSHTLADKKKVICGKSQQNLRRRTKIHKRANVAVQCVSLLFVFRNYRGQTWAPRQIYLTEDFRGSSPLPLHQNAGMTSTLQTLPSSSHHSALRSQICCHLYSWSKAVPMQAMKAYRRNSDIAPLIRNFATRSRLSHQLHAPAALTPVPIEYEGRWILEPIWR